MPTLRSPRSCPLRYLETQVEADTSLNADLRRLVTRMCRAATRAAGDDTEVKMLSSLAICSWMRAMKADVDAATTVRALDQLGRTLRSLGLTVIGRDGFLAGGNGRGKMKPLREEGGAKSARPAYVERSERVEALLDQFWDLSKADCDAFFDEIDKVVAAANAESAAKAGNEVDEEGGDGAAEGGNDGL